nr:reverse transcriptase domain-containing protein [Tanacetum cinerariifolium]
MGTHDDEARSSRSKRPRQHETMEEDVLNRMGYDGEINDMLRIRLREAGSNEEIFTSVAWIRAFNINEPNYAKLCHEFYSTYEYDEVCADDELQTNKIIKFRLGGHAHSLTLLEFTRRLGLYQAVELEEEGFNVYFEEGLRNDEHFNAQDYWLSISREEHLSLSQSHTSTIRNLIIRVIHKMITYCLCQIMTGYDKIQKNDIWILKGVVRSLSSLVYCRDLDTITLRDLIDSNCKLIPEDPQPGVPRVGVFGWFVTKRGVHWRWQQQHRGVFVSAAETAANVGGVCLVLPRQQQLEGCLFGLPRQAANVGRCLVSAAETAAIRGVFVWAAETSSQRREVFVSTFLFLEFEEVMRLLLVGSLSSSEVGSGGGVIGLAISLPLDLASPFGLVSMYHKNRDRHCRYRPVASIGRGSLKPTVIISSLKLSRDQTSNPTSSTNPTPKGRIRRSSKQKVENSNFEEHLPLVATMTDNRTMAEMLRAPTEGCVEAIVVPPILAEQFELKHSLINMMTSEQFFGLEKDNPHDHIRWWQFVGKNPQDALTIIENKSKIRNPQSKPIASSVNSCDINSSSEIAKLTHAVNQQTSAVTTAMTAMLKQLQANPPPAPVKAVEKICVTCGGAHPYYQCLAAGGNTFPEFKDNIQGYVSAAADNYNQGNPGYRPQGVANQMRPPGFAQSNVQNNQNRFGQPQGFNRGTNFNQEQPYQATAQSNQNFHLNELEKIKRMNDVSMKAMQNQIDMVKNELINEMKISIQTSLLNQTNEIKNMMASLLQMNTASTSGSGSLLGNTVANPKGELKAITTRCGLVTNGPTVPTPPKFVTPEEDECVEETYTDPDLTEYTIKVPPPLALVLMPRYQKMLKALLSNKEKLQELANTPLNKNCSAVILKKLPKKLGDPRKFLIPYGFSKLKCKALADLGASINLMPLSVWRKLGLPDLIPTRMTLKLANRAICTPDGIARDVFVSVGKFTFLADFVIVNYESDPRVTLILERPFLRTARALINVHGEEMILSDGDERLTLNMKHDTASYSNHPHRESVNLINIFNVSSEDCLEVSVSNQTSGNPTFSLHKEITSPKVTHEIQDLEGCNFLFEELPDIDSFNDIHPYFDDNPLSGSTTYSSNSLLEEFTDELARITYPPDYDDNLQCDIESDLKEIEFLLYQGKDSGLKDSIDQMNLANFDDYFVDPTPEMFIDEHAPDYSFPLRFDVYDDDFLEIEFDADNFYDDPFDSKGEKIKESKLLINELDLPCDFLHYFEYDSFNSQDFSRDDDLPSQQRGQGI